VKDRFISCRIKARLFDLLSDLVPQNSMKAVTEHLIVLECAVHRSHELEAFVQNRRCEEIRIETASFSFRTIFDADPKHSGMNKLYGIDSACERNDIWKLLILLALLESFTPTGDLPIASRGSHTLPPLTFWAGGPPLAIFARTIPTEGAPSLRFLQGWAAMPRVLFDFVVDTSNPLSTGISDSRPSQETRRTGRPQ